MTVKNFRIIIVIGLIVVFSVFFATFRIFPSTKMKFNLSKEERVALEGRARNYGDAVAANSLALYYYYSKDDEGKAIYWYEFAAGLGDEKARQALEDLRGSNHGRE